MKLGTVSVGVVTLVGAASFAMAAPAAAATAPASGDTGHDVSYPQCGSPLPSTGTFGVVGVTNGIAYSSNPCLAGEWQWASSLPGTPALYTTPANPAPTSSYYWPASGTSDPALCTDSTSTTDPGCAYDYGWHAAANALSTALAGAPSARTVPWWLDVETANTYNGDGYSNAADLQGMVDYLRVAGVPSVGFYSTDYQWGVITGGWTTTNDASYRAAWSYEFAPRFSMAQSPVWEAGVGTVSDAQATCGATFTGVATQLAQYSDGPYDGDLVCGPASAPPSVPPPGDGGDTNN